MAKLPEDNISLDILGVIRHEANNEIVEREHDGYVSGDVVIMSCIGNILY